MTADIAQIRALTLVQLGEIGTHTVRGVLTHDTDELPADIFAALITLRRDGRITLPAARRLGHWTPAELTDSGYQLLRRQTQEPLRQ